MPRLAHRRPGTGAARRSGFRGVGAGGGSAPAWTPLDDADTVLWLDAELSARTDDGGGLISQWNDLSGNDYHATSSGALRPTYSATALGGAYPAMTFPGGAKQMLTPALAALAGASGVTVIGVFKINTTTANRVILEYNTGGGVTAAGWALYDNNTNANSLTFHARGNVGANFWRSAVDSETLTTHKVISASVDFSLAGASELQAIRSNSTALSGAQTNSNNNTGTFASAVLSISDRVTTGASVALELGALIVVKRTLSDADKLVFERYLGDRFGLPFSDVMATWSTPSILVAGQSNALSQLDSYTTIDLYDGPHVSPRVWAYKDTDISSYREVQTWAGLRGNQPGGADWEGWDLVMACDLFRNRQRAPQVLMVAKGATSLAVDWDPATVGSLFERAEDTLATADSTHPSPPASPIPVVVWVQAEADANNVNYANAYEANLLNLISEADARWTGFANAHWIIVQLHEDAVYPGTPTVRAAQAAVVASLGGRATLVDPTSYGSLHDGVHWSQALAIAMGPVIAAAVAAVT